MMQDDSLGVPQPNVHSSIFEPVFLFTVQPVEFATHFSSILSYWKNCSLLGVMLSVAAERERYRN